MTKYVSIYMKDVSLDVNVRGIELPDDEFIIHSEIVKIKDTDNMLRHMLRVTIKKVRMSPNVSKTPIA